MGIQTNKGLMDIKNKYTYINWRIILAKFYKDLIVIWPEIKKLNTDLPKQEILSQNSN